MSATLKAPFTYFGAKRRKEVVEPVWTAFGPRINSYIEPFCGSAAMLLAPGWWCYGVNIWIGGGWCGGIKRGHPRPNLNSGQGVHALGVTRLPSIGNDRGINGVSAPPALEWMQRLCERLRRVRIVCGDWRRVLGPSVLGKGKNVGGRLPCAIFFDPPYTHEIRDPDLYAEDDPKVAAECAEWCREHGDDPDLRLCLAGYHGEHDMPSNWTVYR